MVQQVSAGTRECTGAVAQLEQRGPFQSNGQESPLMNEGFGGGDEVCSRTTNLIAWNMPVEVEGVFLTQGALSDLLLCGGCTKGGCRES